MPYEAYIGYLAAEDQTTRQEIVDGEPIVVEVRDLDTFERLIVRALVAEPPGAVEGGDELWVLDWTEKRREQAWSIKVLEELDEAAAEAARSDIGAQDLTAAADESQKYGGRRYKGSQLPEMMGQEEARKYFENLVSKGKKG